MKSFKFEQKFDPHDPKQAKQAEVFFQTTKEIWKTVKKWDPKTGKGHITRAHFVTYLYKTLHPLFPYWIKKNGKHSFPRMHSLYNKSGFVSERALDWVFNVTGYLPLTEAAFDDEVNALILKHPKENAHKIIIERIKADMMLRLQFLGTQTRYLTQFHERVISTNDMMELKIPPIKISQSYSQFKANRQSSGD